METILKLRLSSWGET